MAEYGWNETKDRELRASRGVGFGDIVDAIARGGLLDVLEHPRSDRYANQRVFIVRVRDYVYLVPFVESEELIFLKTIIPSRKAKRMYGGDKS